MAATENNYQFTSHSQSGKHFRMGRIFGSDGKALVLPIDHGTMLGRVEGLEDPIRALERFVALNCDGFLIGPGVALRTASLFANRNAPARLLTLDSYWNEGAVGSSVMISSVASAAALGVDAVKLLMPWNVSAKQRARLVGFVAEVIQAAEPYGIPVMAEPIAFDMARGPEAVAIEAHGCRVAAEMGVDILKVAYPGSIDTLADWCSELHVPIVMLGGPKGGTTEDLLSMVRDAISAGASGIVVGRRVWQRPIEEAAALIGKLKAIVHPGTADS